MKITIRSKLIFAISALMVVLFASASYLFINEKRKELAQDIYVNTLAFSKLTAPNIAYDYDLYLAQNSFVYFNREIASVFEQNGDLDAVKIISYMGDILYDSDEDADKKYEGKSRTVKNTEFLSQVKSENISIKTLDGRTVFVKQDLKGVLSYVDKNEKPVEAVEEGILIDYFVVPANEKYSVVYKLDYTNLDARVARMQSRIIYLAIFGIMMGMILSFVMAGQISKPVAQLVEGASEIAKGNFKVRVDIKTRDEMNFLGSAFNKMAADLEVSIGAKLYQERVTRELELAIQIQDQLIPDQEEIPKIEGIEIAAGIIPAEEIGGDIYDFLKLDDQHLLMYLGDVTGHGVPAGIISSISSALFYGYGVSSDLKKILLDVNRVLKVKTMPTMFLTLCLMQWDAATKKFTYASAGHEQILHYKAAQKMAEYKAAGGIALGMLPDISKHITVQEIDFQPGDYLVIYSDGIPECWKNDKDLYTMERLKAFAEKIGNQISPTEIRDAILKDVKDFAAGHKQMDDITIMVIKRI